MLKLIIGFAVGYWVACNKESVCEYLNNLGKLYFKKDKDSTSTEEKNNE